MTKEEFVEMLTIMHARTETGEVMAARTQEDVGSDDADDWASLLSTAFGQLVLDDSDEAPRREPDRFGDLRTVTSVYALDAIDSWPDGLFEKLSRYIWWIDPDDEINPLDVIVLTLEGPN